jgi:hypothetical protein
MGKRLCSEWKFGPAFTCAGERTATAWRDQLQRGADRDRVLDVALLVLRDRVLVHLAARLQRRAGQRRLVLPLLLGVCSAVATDLLELAAEEGADEVDAALEAFLREGELVEAVDGAAADLQQLAEAVFGEVDEQRAA